MRYLRYIIPIFLLGFALPAMAGIDWFASGNPSNDKLLRMTTEKAQGEALARAIGNCTPSKPFYMGTELHPPNRLVSFWSLTCDNLDKSFMIAIAPDETGSTKVISCNLLHGNPWKCYNKLRTLK